MVKQYTANIYNWLKTKLNSTASNSKMNGNQSAGYSNLIARADHVHPVDTSRAPTSHASSDTTYGVGSTSNYGHVKVDSSPTDSSSNAVASGGVKTVLDTKQNAVETQAKVTQFTNKDRVDISRLLNFMENGSGSNYYTLNFKMGMGYASGTLISIFDESDAKNRLATNNIVVYEASSHNPLFAAMIYKNGTAQPDNTTTITFKSIDGTVIGTSTTKANASSVYPKYTFLSKNYQDVFPDGGGIFYFYAEATIDGSVRKSNILTVFVKDTNNKLDYNLWSGGEYSNNITGLNRRNDSLIIVSNDYSMIGESSLRIQRTSSTQTSTAYFTIANDGSSTITVGLDVYCPANALVIQLYDGSNVLSQVTVPAGNCNDIVLTGQSDAATLYVRFLFVNQKDYAFLDNISAITS